MTRVTDMSGCVNFNRSEFTLLLTQPDMPLTRVTALGLLGASHKDAVAEHLLPREMERRGVACHEARKRTNAVPMDQRKAAGCSRAGRSEPRGG